MNVYDFDNTIFKGDSTFKFYIFSLKKHPATIKYLPKLFGAFVKFYIFKKGTKTDFKEKMFSFVKYSTQQDINEFWNKNKIRIKKWYLEQQKNDDVIISASPYFLLKPICDELDIKYLIASNVSKDTGKYNGINCHGTEKVRRFREKFQNKNIDSFYSDSKSDTPLAEIANQAFIVKGDKILPW